MSDSHLLRLAKIVRDITQNRHIDLDRYHDAQALVNDLEDAETLARPDEAAPRTITRAQYAWVLEEIARVARDEATPDNAAARVMQVVGLTVEDA